HEMDAGPSGSRLQAPCSVEVDLVDGDGIRTALELRRELRDLAAHRLEVLPRVRGSAVEHIDQRLGALDVAQEPLPEAGALSRALDQARDVRQHDAAALDVGHAKFRVESRERVIGDFGPSGGHRPKQRGLAGVRRSHQADVRDELEVERDLALVALEPWLGEVWRLAGRALEVDVAATSFAAAGDHRGRARAI